MFTILKKKQTHYTQQVEFIREYWNDVFTPFLSSYEAGHTPNPDIACNREIKFKRFIQHCIDHYQVDYIATGHTQASFFFFF